MPTDTESAVRAWVNDPRETTHYNGCEAAHSRCAIAWALAEIDRVRAERDVLLSEVRAGRAARRGGHSDACLRDMERYAQTTMPCSCGLVEYKAARAATDAVLADV
jgi:hypothetical protein